MFPSNHLLSFQSYYQNSRGNMLFQSDRYCLLLFKCHMEFYKCGVHTGEISN